MVVMNRFVRALDKYGRKLGILGRKQKDEDMPRTIMTEETTKLMDELLTGLRNYIYDQALVFVAERGPPYIMLPEDIARVVNDEPISLKVTTEES